MVQTSADVILNYEWESSWGSEATGDKNFGDISNFSVTRSNNMISVSGLGDQDPAAQVAGSFGGSFSMDLVPRDWWWLRGIIGDPAKDGSGPYTYTYTYDDVADSFTMDYAINATTDSVHTITGCLMNSVTLNINAGEVVTASIEGQYKTETESSSSIYTQVASTDAPFTAANASLSLWGSSITPITSCSLTFNRNLIPTYGLGSREPAALSHGMRTIDMSLSLPFEDVSEILDNIWGSDGDVNTTSVSEPAGATALTITNGGAGTALRSFVVTIPTATLFPGSSTRTDPAGDVLTNDVTLTARDLTSIVWTNNTAAEA